MGLHCYYIRELLGAVSSSGIGCFIGNQCVNILAYADDLVLLAPSWHAFNRCWIFYIYRAL